MEIIVKQDDGVSRIDIPKTLDAVTSPFFKQTLTEVIEAADKIELDFSDTVMVSSAGLRVLMQAQKNVKKSEKSMIFKNVSADVMEIFDITGVTKIFEIV